MTRQRPAILTCRPVQFQDSRMSGTGFAQLAKGGITCFSTMLRVMPRARGNRLLPKPFHLEQQEHFPAAGRQRIDRLLQALQLQRGFVASIRQRHAGSTRASSTPGILRAHGTPRMRSTAMLDRDPQKQALARAPTAGRAGPASGWRLPGTRPRLRARTAACVRAGSISRYSASKSSPAAGELVSKPEPGGRTELWKAATRAIPGLRREATLAGWCECAWLARRERSGWPEVWSKPVIPTGGEASAFRPR